MNDQKQDTAAQNRAMNPKANQGGPKIFVEGRKADEAKSMYEGHDVTLTHTMTEIIEALKSHYTSSSSSGGSEGGSDSAAATGRGGGTDAISTTGPVNFSTSTYTEMVTSGAKASDKSNGWGRDS